MDRIIRSDCWQQKYNILSYGAVSTRTWAHTFGRQCPAVGRLLYSWQFFNALCLASSKATGIKPDSERTCQDMAIIGNGCFAASMRLRPQNVPFAFGLHLLIRLPGIPPSSITTISPPAPCRLIYFKQLATSYINALLFLFWAFLLSLSVGQILRLCKKVYRFLDLSFCPILSDFDACFTLHLNCLLIWV